jgi:hypothetical protein
VELPGRPQEQGDHEHGTAVEDEPGDRLPQGEVEEIWIEERHTAPSSANGKAIARIMRPAHAVEKRKG